MATYLGANLISLIVMLILQPLHNWNITWHIASKFSFVTNMTMDCIICLLIFKNLIIFDTITFLVMDKKIAIIKKTISCCSLNNGSKRTINMKHLLRFIDHTKT